MSLQVLAQDMAARGRGPDTMLVHMAPKEVAGLQALARAHGGSLTVNPQTGLPEAGFLSSILPMIAGIALGPAGFGLTAMQAGLAAGALGTVATGSLRKGLMAGLGAYGGAGLMGSVAGAGNAAASNMAAAEAAAAGNTAAQQALIPSGVPVAPVAPVAAPVAATPPAYLQGMVDPMGGFPGGAATAAAPPIAPVTPAVAPPVATAPMVSTNGAFSYEQMRAMGLSDAEIAQNAREYASSLKGTAQSPFSQATQQARENPLATGFKAIYDKPSLLLNKDNLKFGLAAAAPLMFQEQKAVNAPPDTEQFRFAYNPNREMPPTRMGDVGEYRYFQPSYTRLAADGGLMDLPVERMSDRNDAMMSAVNGAQMYAAGGVSHLGDYSDGGRLLRGPGDGVSDSIPAVIGRKRPARLADGEFVIPARIVSELGNGSTEAGARKLYAMMDRVQRARGKTTGKGKVAKNTRSDKYLPA